MNLQRIVIIGASLAAPPGDRRPGGTRTWMVNLSDMRNSKYPGGPNAVWLLLLLMVFVLITLTVGLVAREAIREPEAAPFLPSLVR